VHVYILAPTAAAWAGSDRQWLEPKKMIQMLEAMAQKLPIRPARRFNLARDGAAHERCGSMVFHLIARGNRTGSWREFPSENWSYWSDLNRSSCCDGRRGTGTSWEVPAEIAKKFYQVVLPQTEDTSITNRSRIDQQSMRMTVVTLENRNGPGAHRKARCG